ncbi:MAG TPA: HK97-fold major capsid protein [Anaerovoracaceae bacterium]|nr:HK97-fold major capsid protein [Anaerovoracaceae bacterium]
MSFFNTRGEMNASSVRDALQTLTKYASILEENVPSNMALSGQPGLNDERRDELISRAIMTHDGKIALAQAMANPIRRNLDYQGIARRALVVDPLPQGALPVYDRDIDVAAVVISSNGTGPESRVFGDRVTVPEFEIYSNPTVRIAEVKRRRFNVIDRAVQKARQEIMAQEDANVFAALDSASSVENVVQDLADGGMLKRDLVEIKVQIDRWDLVTTKFFMNINEFTDILNWASGGGQGATGGEVDPVTQREILQTGLYAHIWGADIMVSKIVPAGTVYGCADPEFVGVMPVRQDIEVLPADEPKQLKLGWVVSEIIGIGIVNPRGVAKGNKSVVLGA